MPQGEFVAFLPGDNQDLATSDTHAVIEIINQDLSQLLRLPPQQFWQVVLSDKSLHLSLDSFLRFRRRCYDDSVDSIQGTSDLLLQLSQRVFRVYWRMAHPQDKQQQPAAAAAVGSSTQQQQQQLPSRSKVAEHLYNSQLIDVPKMLDIAVLYGPGNSKLTGQLLQQLLVLQPYYSKDIMRLAEPLSGNLYELAENVKRLADRLLRGTAATAPADRQQLLVELAEAVKYFVDAFLTLQAFVDCLPQAAALLLHPDHHGSVLLAIAVVHATLLPVLQRISQQPDAAVVQGLHPARILQLQQCAVSLVFHMLQAAFCTAAGASAAAAAYGDGFPVGSSSNAAETLPGPQQQQQGLNAELQGQELMNLLMLLAHPSDHLYGGASSSVDAGAKGGLLAAVNHSHHLDVAVAAAVDQGLLSLDDAQFDYLLALVDGDRDLLQHRSQQQKQQGPTSTTSAAATQGSGSQPPADLSDMIRSIKELLPDYGDGFLTAVLFHSHWNAEQAINCLLEGSLPTEVQGLDISLRTWEPPGSKGSQGPSNTAAAAAGSSRDNNNSISWTGLAQEAAAAAAAPAAAPMALPSLEQAAAAGPRPQVDRRTGRILGALPGQVRSVTKNMAYELQYEYDDEYDDSFDDLIGPGHDGVCDIEGEDSSADAHGGSRPVRRGAARPSPAVAAARTADIYADEPASSSRGPPQQQRQQQQQRARQQREGKQWVLDGRVYNYKKEGAVEVAGQAGAQKALQAAQQAAQEIYGLGPGGNVPVAVEDRQQDKKVSSGDKKGPDMNRGPGAAAAAATAALGGGRDVGSGTGQRGGGRGGRGRGDTTAAGADVASNSTFDGRGRGRGGYLHKEQHKSAVANHHRKDRAMAKQAKGMY